MEKMIFGNVVAYAKGWYKRQDSVHDIWKDMVHCLEADGYWCGSKTDVARWCMNKWDQYYEFFKHLNNSFGICWYRNNIKRYMEDTEGDELDAIILLFISSIAYGHKSDYEKIYIPNSKVLPFKKDPEHIDETTGEIIPEETDEDIINKFKSWNNDVEIFEQDLDDLYYDYNDIEEKIKEIENKKQYLYW